MLEAMAHFAVEPFAAFFALGETPTSRTAPRLAQAYILRTGDDRLIASTCHPWKNSGPAWVAALESPNSEPTRASTPANGALPSTTPCG